jgi:protein-disulfide isomerase
VWREPEPRQLLRTVFPGTGDRQGVDNYYKEVVKVMLGMCILFAAVVVLGGSHFLSKSLTENDRESLAKIIQNLSQQQPIVIAADVGPAMGAEDSKVLVIEFSDFMCPFCAQASKYLRLTAKNTQDIARFVFRHYPLDKRCNRKLSSNMHPGSCLLAEAAACAGEQNRFWEYHDIAFETKGNISQPVVMKIASDIGLDSGAFERCMDSGRGRKIVMDDIETAVNAGIRSTPTLVINGRVLRGVPKPWMLNDILRYAAENLPLPKPVKPSAE